MTDTQAINKSLKRRVAWGLGREERLKIKLAKAKSRIEVLTIQRDSYKKTIADMQQRIAQVERLGF